MLYETWTVTEYIPFCNDYLWPETSKIIEINLSHFTFSTTTFTEMMVWYVGGIWKLYGHNQRRNNGNDKKATWHERNSALWQSVFGIVSCKCYHQFEWLDWLEFWAANDKKTGNMATRKMMKKGDGIFCLIFSTAFILIFFFKLFWVNKRCVMKIIGKGIRAFKELILFRCEKINIRECSKMVCCTLEIGWNQQCAVVAEVNCNLHNIIS